MLGFRALLDETIANAARWLIGLTGRKIGPGPKVIVHGEPVHLGYTDGLYDAPQTPWVNWHSADCSAEQCVCSTSSAIVQPTLAESALSWLESSFPDADKWHVERGNAKWHVEPKRSA